MGNTMFYIEAKVHGDIFLRIVRKSVLLKAAEKKQNKQTNPQALISVDILKCLASGGYPTRQHLLLLLKGHGSGSLLNS